MNPIYIHIGTQKTGSTAIQAALVSNNDPLEKLGYNFVRAGRKRAAHNHIAVTDRNGDATSLVQDVVAEIDASPDKTHILSSEMFFRAPIAKTLAQGFPSQLRSRVKIIAYVRRQDSFLEAMYKQLLKNGRFHGSPADFAQKKFNNAKYTLVLDAYAEAFGREALCVKPFERQHFKNGDVATDFFEQVGLSDEDTAQWTYKTSNVTLSREASELLGMLSRDTDINTRQLIRDLAQTRPEGVVRSGDCYSMSERRSLMDMYREDNQLLREKYCPDFDPLFDQNDFETEENEMLDTADARLERVEKAVQAMVSAIGRTHHSQVKK